MKDEIAPKGVAQQFRDRGFYVRVRAHMPKTEVFPRFLPPSRHAAVVKTLICKAKDRVFCLVLSYGARADLKRVARAFGTSRIDMVSDDQVLDLTGFRVGAVSPVINSDVITFVCDRALLGLSHLYINGGQHGLQLRVRSEHLLQLRPFLILDFALSKEKAADLREGAT